MPRHKTPTLSREQLRELAELSTNVALWYSHNYDGTIRGPFNRWFTCKEVLPQDEKHVASVAADTEFAAAAMNNIIPLLDEVEALEKKVGDLQLELILMGRIIE